MMSVANISIRDIVGEPIWVSTDDGQKVFGQLDATLSNGSEVYLSFEGREILITAFLNAAIGQLYGGKYDESFLDSHLHFVDVSDDDQAMIERAIENAKKYFANMQGYQEAWKEVVDEDE